MMQKTVVVLMILLGVNSHLFSQRVIKGKVVDSHQKPVEGFNALLLKSDNTVVKGGFFFDGDYQISCSKGNYVLQISALGYQTHQFEIFVKDSLTNLSTIVLKSSVVALDEVTVKARRNLYSKKNNKLIVNVKNTILEESGSAIDVMRKSAVLNVDSDNKINVLGKGKTAVYVNGKKISSPELLSIISSKEIKSVEVIDNPSAKYDSDIQAVVNIITNKKTTNKQGFTLVNTVTKRTDWNNKTNVQYFNDSKKNSLFLSYSYGSYRKKNDEEYNRQYPYYKDKITISNDIDKQLNIKKNQHYARLSNIYELNQYNILTFVANAGYYSGAYGTLNSTEILKNNLLNSSLSTAIYSPIKRTLLNGMLNYVLFPHHKRGIKWDFSAEKYYYSYQKNDRIEETNNMGMVKMKHNDINNIFHLHSAEAIGETTVNKNLYLQAGFQFSEHKNKSNNISSALANKNNRFINKEERYATFCNIKWKKQKWMINAGLRWEILSRNANINNQSIVDKSSSDFLPNISIGKDFSNKLNLKASISRRFKRPSFQQLNPAITYIDSLSIMQGNPNLRNEVIDLYQLKFSFMKYASVSAHYKNISDAMIWFVEGLPQNKDIFRAMQVNVPKQTIFGMDAVLPYQNKHLTFYLASGWQFMKNRSENYKHLKQFSWYLKSGLDVNLPLGIKMNLTGLYFSDGINGIWNYDNAYQIDAQLQKLFLSKRLAVSLLINDIFCSNKIHSRLNIGKSITDYTYYKDNQSISLRIRYTINSNKNKSFKKSLLQDAANRIDTEEE